MLNLQEHFPPQNGRLVPARVSTERVNRFILYVDFHRTKMIQQVKCHQLSQLNKAYFITLLTLLIHLETCWWQQQKLVQIVGEERCPSSTIVSWLCTASSVQKGFIKQLTPSTNEHGLFESVLNVMYFDLSEHSSKICESGTALGTHSFTATKRRINLAPSEGGRAKHAGLTALHSYLCSKYIQTMMGHIMLWFVSLLTTLELLYCNSRDLARCCKCCLSVSTHFSSSKQPWLSMPDEFLHFKTGLKHEFS